jgi:hypothetical protein
MHSRRRQRDVAEQTERHTHYAIETTLGCRQGFFGLIASGWDIEDTTGKGARGPVPEQTAEVESLVGLFDSERGSGVLWTGRLPPPCHVATTASRAVNSI